MPMTDEDRKAYLASVLKERAKYEREGNTEEVEHCNKVLSGFEGQRAAPRSNAPRRAAKR